MRKALVMLLALAVAMVIAHYSRFGANVYAIGGDRTSAALMETTCWFSS